MPFEAGSLHTMLAPLWQRAAAGDVVLTSNTSAARFLRERYADSCGSAGLSTWRTPEILPWNTWLQQCWQQRIATGAEERVLLSGAQERLVWESICGTADRMFAPLAESAWGLVWRHAGGQSSLNRTDAPKFSEWAEAFARTGRRNGWVTAAELPYAMDSTPEVMTHGCVLAGFDVISPAQEKLLRGVRHTTFSPAHAHASRPRAASFADAAACATAAARWAQLRTAGRRNAQVAIVAPHVDAVRGELSRALEQTVGPQNFEFSLGIPLAFYPHTRVALLLLEWLQRPLRVAELTEVLLAPGMSREDGNAAARYDARLRRAFSSPLPEISLQEFTAKLASDTRGEDWQRLRPLARRAERVQAMMVKAARRMKPSERARLFRAVLETWDYALPTDAASEEFQGAQSWQDLLEEFSKLDIVSGTMSLGESVFVLHRMARETVFQPASREAAVQIVGPLESAGSLFDGIFFLGAYEGSWPQFGSPHPLLSGALQMKTAMPHGSASIDLSAGEAVTQRLVRSAAEVIFTWPQRMEGVEVRPSSLVADARPVDQQLQDLLAASGTHPAPATVEDDDELPVIWKSDRGTLGFSALDNQAACGFRAFAALRLEAKALDCPDEGPDRGDRGTIVHIIMERVWKGSDKPPGTPGLKSHAALLARHQDGTLREFVEECVRAALAEQSASAWQRAFHEIEHRRLTTLVMEWLALELAREPFIVLDAEKKAPAEVEGLKFDLRVDRLDAICNHGDATKQLVLLDYKTGEAKTEGWQVPLERAQVPLYATFAIGQERGEVEAVAFACIGEKLRFQGLVSRSRILPDISADKYPLSAEIRENWRIDLERLASEFRDGVSPVAPLHGRETCRFCDFPSLCRIAEKRVAGLDDEPDEEPGD